MTERGSKLSGLLTTLSVGAIGLALFASTVIASGPSTYRGDFRFDHGVSTVRLDVRYNEAGRPRSVTFQAKQVKLFCDDGSRLRLPVNPVKMPVDSDGVFESFDYSSNSIESQGFLGVRGKIVSAHSANGKVSIGLDQPQPNTDCGTRGAGDWRAKR